MLAKKLTDLIKIYDDVVDEDACKHAIKIFENKYHTQTKTIFVRETHSILNLVSKFLSRFFGI